MKKLIPAFLGVFLFIGIVGYFYKNPTILKGKKIVAVEKSLDTDELKPIFIDGIEVDAKISKDEPSRDKGLGGLTYLAENQGMLFVFDEQNTRPTFWMKDMKFPIDIVRIDNGKIVQIDKNVQPEPGVSKNDLKLYPSNQPIDYVLELPANFTESNNVKVGDPIDLSKAL